MYRIITGVLLPKHVYNKQKSRETAEKINKFADEENRNIAMSGTGQG